MVVCSTSRVKPKGSPFELLSFFISSHTAAGEFSPSLVLRLACMENGQDWVNGERAPQRVMGRDCRASVCSQHFLLFLLTWKIENLMWGETKGQFCDGLMACLDSVGAIKVQGPQHRMMGSC